MKSLLIFFAVLSILATKLTKAEELVLYEGSEAPSKKHYFVVNQSRISASEECKNKKCIAYQAALGKIAFPKQIEWESGGVNPTSIVCRKLGAEPRIGYFENKNEVSLCSFRDGSFIFGWDLMRLFKNQK